MQILVEVANIQVRSLKTEVEKGSACTVIVRGLVGPKAQANAGLKWRRLFTCGLRCTGRKGCRLIFLHRDKEIASTSVGTRRGNANEPVDAA